MRKPSTSMKSTNTTRKSKISALTGLKMVMHIRSGSNLEVMADAGKDGWWNDDLCGLFCFACRGRWNLSKCSGSFAWVHGKVCRNHQTGWLPWKGNWLVSWPPSYYGCWLSGIHVSTHMLSQQFQELFLTVAMDSTRTESARKSESWSL